MNNFDQPTQEELGNIENETNGGIVLTGTASMGQMGTTVGHIDFGESEDSYLFSFTLPGVKRDDLTCDFKANGDVSITGSTTAGEETVIRNGITFQMQTQNFCPTGHFSISFKLPGPINLDIHYGHFGSNGILECIVMKKKVSQDIVG